MRSSFNHILIVNFLLLTFAIVVEQSRFVPRSENVHLGRGIQSRQWGPWCSEDSECGLGYCQAYMCQCYPGYISWRFMEVCNYEQRKKLTAFLLSFFVGILGVDWFYLSQGTAGYIIVGIVKLLISCGCCIGWPFVFLNAGKKSRKYAVTGNVVNVTLTAISLIWWLIDWIRILSNVFYDGHRAPLQPWGYEYYYSNRIPFRY